MQLKRFDLFKNSPRLRYAAIALTVLGLIGITIADRQAWFSVWGREIPTDLTIDCPELEKGCTFELKKKTIKVQSNTPVETGKPFTLNVEGDIVSARAVWRMVKMDMGPNNYKLIYDKANHLYAQVTLPPCPHGSKEWQLHLELNARAVDINTRIRDDKPATR